MRLRLISGLVCTVLGILAAVLFVGLSLDQGSSTASDRSFVAVLAGIFLVTGVALVVVDFRKRGRPPGFFATVAGVLVGVLGVVVAAGILAANDVQLDGGKGTRGLVIAIVAVAGIGPGMGVHWLIKRASRREAA
jgi:uncharacterized membrane protein HdeD (DUF308 family)